MALEYLEATAAVVFLGVAAVGAGRWIAPLLPRRATPVDALALVPLCGLGVLGTLLFLIGQTVFSRMVIVIVLTLAAILGIAPAIALVRHALLLFKRESVPKLAAAAIIVILLVTAVAGLAPIIGDWGNDAVAYHLLGPKVWLREGVIRPVPDNCHTAFPQILEVLFAAVTVVGGDRAPGFSSVLTLPLLLLVVGAMARRAGLGANGAWWAAALAATMPAIYAGAHIAFVDVFYASLVLAAARIGLDAERRVEFLAFGLFCGFAIGTKYTGILAFGALLICTSVLAMWRKPRVPLAANLAIAACVACLVGAPALIRNWLLLGSPIYPPTEAMLRFFHPKYLSVQTVQAFQAYIWQRGQGLGRGPLALLLLPFQLTYHTSNFHGAGGIGLTPLALAPLGLLAARRERFAKGLMLLAALLTLIWFVTQQESRFLIHVYAISAIFAVIGWRWVLAGGNKWTATLSAVLIGLSVLYGIVMITGGRRFDLRAAVSPSYAEKLRTERIPFHQSFAFLNHDAAAQKILILDRSVPPYYLDKNYLKPVGQWGEEVLRYANDTARVLAHLKELGISHVLDVNSNAAAFQVPKNYPGLALVLDLPDQRIYRVAN